VIGPAGVRDVAGEVGEEVEKLGEIADAGMVVSVLIFTITMDAIIKPYHMTVCTYKATPHQHHSEVTVFKINKRHSFLLTWLHFSFTRRTIPRIY
jgi:hypothetical protein